LYELGKQKVHQRNESNSNLMVSSPSKSVSNVTNNNQDNQQTIKEITKNSNYTFRPQIQKKSQLLKRDKPVEQHLYEDYIERRKKKEIAVQGIEANF
jgi:hypothetical protein